MLALSPAMRAFVFTKVFSGFTNKECARLAGYSASSDNVLNVIAHNIAHDPRVQKALAEEGHKVLRSEVTNCIRSLIEIRDDPTTEKKDKIKCNIELLNRSGFHAITESISHVELHMTESQKDARILSLAAELGISKDEARKMLIAPSSSEKIIDAAYEEMTPPEPPRELTPEEKEYRAARDLDNEQRRRRARMTPEERAEYDAQARAEKSARFKDEYRKAQQQGNGDTPDAAPQPVAGTVAEYDPNDLSDIY